MRVVLATANRDKAREISAVLAGAGLELVPRPDEVGEVEETEATLEGNARLKARAVASATGMPALADDTGLEVAALGGRPGVYSSRYAGAGATYADNVAKLLDELGEAQDRKARFRTVVCLAYPDGREVLAEGAVEGLIATEARGGAGFGYDPVFVPAEGEGLTFAEMPLDGKNALSHRARALRALADLLAGTVR